LKKRLLKKLSDQQSFNQEMFYFEDVESLKNLMIKILSCSICHLHVCLFGSTRLGKTSMAVAFSEISSDSENSGNNPY
jgi:hypothetical protein